MREGVLPTALLVEIKPGNDKSGAYGPSIQTKLTGVKFKIETEELQVDW